jgi:hypothetical protein
MGIQGVESSTVSALHVDLGFGPVKALLDSGAVHTLMSGDTNQRLRQAAPFFPVSAVQVKCVTAVGQSFPIRLAVSCKGNLVSMWLKIWFTRLFSGLISWGRLSC